MIIWTDDEWDFLADSAFRIFQKDPGVSLLTIARNLMSQMPRHRQRKLNTVSQIKPLLMRVRLKLLESQVALEEAQRALEASKQSLEKTVKQLEDAKEAISLLNKFRADVELQYDVLLRWTREWLHPSDPRPLGLILESELAKSIPKMKEFRPDARRQIPRIVIIGLLPEQVQIVRSHFGNEVDLRFIPKNGKLPKFGDVWLVMKKFVSHSIYHEAKKKDGYFRLVEGGLSSLIAEIKSQL